eukprot:403336257
MDSLSIIPTQEIYSYSDTSQNLTQFTKKLVQSYCLQEVFNFLSETELAFLQQLNKHFYSYRIPNAFSLYNNIYTFKPQLYSLGKDLSKQETSLINNNNLGDTSNKNDNEILLNVQLDLRFLNQNLQKCKELKKKQSVQNRTLKNEGVKQANLVNTFEDGVMMVMERLIDSMVQTININLTTLNIQMLQILLDKVCDQQTISQNIQFYRKFLMLCEKLKAGPQQRISQSFKELYDV